MIAKNSTPTRLLVLSAVVATLLVAGTVVIASNQYAFAHHKHQSITNSIHQHQSSRVSTAGANSPVTNSGNQAQSATITNNGGNAG